MRRAATAWSALADRPWRLLASAWPWRSFAYVVSSPFVALGVLAGLDRRRCRGIMLSPVWIGILVLYSLPVLGVGVGRLERWRIRLMQGPDEPPLASPHLALPDTTLRQRIAYRRREPASRVPSATPHCWRFSSAGSPSCLSCSHCWPPESWRCPR